MRLLLFCFVFMSARAAYGAGDTIRVDATVFEVKVYNNSAKIKCNALLEVPEGVSDILVENCSGAYISSSLQVRIKGSAELVSAAYQFRDAKANQTGKPPGEIRIKIKSNAVKKIEIIGTYRINGAGWTPDYSLQFNDSQKSAHLSYTAKIRNNSGLDWNNVQLYLAGSTMADDKLVPKLIPLNLTLVPLPDPLNKRGISDDIGILTNTPAYYFVDGVQKSYWPSNSSLELENHLPGYEYPCDIVTLYEFTQTQTIPNGGTLMPLFEGDLPADFIYKSSEKGVICFVQLTNCRKVNLPVGNVNFPLQHRYGFLDPMHRSDTVQVPMALDREIDQSRVDNQNKPVKQEIAGNLIIERHPIEIILKNNKSETVTVEVMDQIPVTSWQSEISIELKEKNGAVYQPETGQLQWNVTLKPGKEKKIHFEYEVRYPKDRVLKN
jgi:hypothetical protein